MTLALALALVPSPLVTADWTIDRPALAAQPAPTALVAAPLAQPGPAAQPGTAVQPEAPPPVPVPAQGSEPVPEPAAVQTEQPAEQGPAARIDVVAHKHHAPGDPLEGFNRASYKFSTGIDKAVLRPVALAYRRIVPRPARDGLRNILSNIGEPIVLVNDLLQLKVGRAVRTLGRFAINSTLGLAGLFDHAKRKPFYLPHHNNSLGDTLGFYGVGPGPYLYLPILGPTTLRDAVAGQVQGLLLPTIVRTPFRRADYQISTTVISGLDQRATSDDDLRAITEDSVDPYATLRSVVLQDREGEIAGLKSGAMDDLTTSPLATPPDPLLDDPQLDQPPAATTPAAEPDPDAAPRSR